MLGTDANKLRTQSIAVNICMVTGLVIKRVFFLIFWGINRFFAFSKFSFQNFLETVNLIFMGGIMYSFVCLYMQRFAVLDEEGRYPRVIMSLS